MATVLVTSIDSDPPLFIVGAEEELQGGKKEGYQGTAQHHHRSLRHRHGRLVKGRSVAEFTTSVWSLLDYVGIGENRDPIFTGCILLSEPCYLTYCFGIFQHRDFDH